MQVTSKSAKSDGSCFYHSLKPIFAAARLPASNVDAVRRVVADAVTHDDVSAVADIVAGSDAPREAGDSGTTSVDLVRALIEADGPGYDVGSVHKRLVAAMRQTKTLDLSGAIVGRRGGSELCKSVWGSHLDVDVAKRVLAEKGVTLVTATAREVAGSDLGIDLEPVLHLAAQADLRVAVIACDNVHYWTAFCAGEAIAPLSEWREAAQYQKDAAAAAAAAEESGDDALDDEPVTEVTAATEEGGSGDDDGVAALDDEPAPETEEGSSVDFETSESDVSTCGSDGPEYRPSSRFEVCSGRGFPHTSGRRL